MGWDGYKQNLWRPWKICVEMDSDARGNPSKRSIHFCLLLAISTVSRKDECGIGCTYLMVEEVNVVKMKLSGHGWTRRSDSSSWSFKVYAPTWKTPRAIRPKGGSSCITQAVHRGNPSKRSIHFSFGAIDAHILMMQTWRNISSSPVYCRPLQPSVCGVPKDITRERAGFPPIFLWVTCSVPSVPPTWTNPFTYAHVQNVTFPQSNICITMNC